MSNITLHYSDGKATARCQNCDWSGPFDDSLSIVDAEERLTPGEIVPCGECPQCGSLAHLDPPPTWGVESSLNRSRDRQSRLVKKLHRYEAELRAYHALHDLLSEIIEDPDSAVFAQGSEHRAALVEKLTAIPRQLRQ